MPVLRPITPADFDDVLALNQVNVAALAPLAEERLVHLVEVADRANVVEVDGSFAGFVLTFAPGTPYDSDNYLWFADRYDDQFYYLDRIVLDTAFRRQGLGGFVYDAVEGAAAGRYPRLALEVNVEPPNTASLSFHRARGYTEVGRLSQDGKTVSLMTKELS